MSKIIPEFFVFVDFDLYYTEPDSSHGAYARAGAYLSESSSRVWGIFEGGLTKGGGSSSFTAK